MSARINETLRTCAPLSTVSDTFVPARPLIRADENSAERLASEVEPTWVIRSPRFRPALAAGDPANTSTTFRPLGSGATSIPIPLRWGLDWYSNDPETHVAKECK